MQARGGRTLRAKGIDFVGAGAEKLRVLSLQVHVLGHATACALLREYFAESQTVQFDALWSDDHREACSRFVELVLKSRIPSAWIRARNADMLRIRADLAYAYYARRLIERVRPTGRIDVLHLHTQTMGLLSVDFMLRYKTVITLDWTARLGSLATPPSWRWTHAPEYLLERPVLRAAAAVVPWSQWAADSLIRDCGVSPSRIHIVPPGVDLVPFTGIAAARCAEVDHAPMRLLFVGGDFARKGGPLLVRAFLAKFAPQGVMLDVVTKNGHVPVHPQIVVHRNVEAYSAAWKSLYASADVFVLPTRSDPFGIAYVEAMAAGLPVIGSNINAAPEIVVDGETGFLVAVDDESALIEKLQVLVDQKTLRRSMGRLGERRAAERFDARKNAERLAGVFRSVVPKER